MTGSTASPWPVFVTCGPADSLRITIWRSTILAPPLHTTGLNWFGFWSQRVAGGEVFHIFPFILVPGHSERKFLSSFDFPSHNELTTLKEGSQICVRDGVFFDPLVVEFEVGDLWA